MVGISLYDFNNFTLVNNDDLLKDIKWVSQTIQIDEASIDNVQQKVGGSLVLLTGVVSNQITSVKKEKNPPRYIAINDITVRECGFDLTVPQTLNGLAFHPPLFVKTTIEEVNHYKAIIGFHYCLIQ